MEKIILIGGGGHAISCYDLLSTTKKYKILGYLALKESDMSIYSNYLGKDIVLNKIRKKCKNAIIAIGQIKSANLRINKYNLLKKLNFNLPNIKSPLSYISKKIILGQGNVFFHHVIVNANSKIGNNNIINSKSLIEHEVSIGSNNHVSTGSIINGKCIIGNNNFIGSGTIINNNVKIGDNCIISSGSVINKNINNNTKIL